LNYTTDCVCEWKDDKIVSKGCSKDFELNLGNKVKETFGKVIQDLHQLSDLYSLAPMLELHNSNALASMSAVPGSQAEAATFWPALRNNLTKSCNLLQLKVLELGTRCRPMDMSRQHEGESKQFAAGFINLIVFVLAILGATELYNWARTLSREKRDASLVEGEGFLSLPGCQGSNSLRFIAVMSIFLAILLVWERMKEPVGARSPGMIPLSLTGTCESHLQQVQTVFNLCNNVETILLGATAAPSDEGVQDMLGFLQRGMWTISHMFVQ